MPWAELFSEEGNRKTGLHSPRIHYRFAPHSLDHPLVSPDRRDQGERDLSARRDPVDRGQLRSDLLEG